MNEVGRPRDNFPDNLTIRPGLGAPVPRNADAATILRNVATVDAAFHGSGGGGDPPKRSWRGSPEAESARACRHVAGLILPLKDNVVALKAGTGRASLIPKTDMEAAARLRPLAILRLLWP